MTQPDPALQEYYALGHEQARLEDGHGRLEFERTVEILQRHLPAPPARVADIGGGPGRYALWLADAGYHVIHRDLMPLHVEQLRASLTAARHIETRLGDARSLDLESDSVDAALLLGPLYHLTERSDRIDALREVARVLRPGGVAFAATISRWALRLDVTMHLRLQQEHPGLEEFVATAERTGRLAPLQPGGFTAYLHRPDELRAEVADAGLEERGLLGVEGPAGFLPDIDARMRDDIDRRAVLDAARALESVPEALGANPHLLAVATRPR